MIVEERVRNLDRPELLDPDRSAMENGEACADALRNFRTRGNALSVFRIAEGSPSAERIAVMVAAGKHRPDQVDFVVFSAAVLAEQEMVVSERPGETLDPSVNRFHVALERLSARRVCGMVDAIQKALIDGTASLERVSKHRVCEMIAAAIHTGAIDVTRLRSTMRSEVEANCADRG